LVRAADCDLERHTLSHAEVYCAGIAPFFQPEYGRGRLIYSLIASLDGYVENELDSTNWERGRAVMLLA
jgi:hypothetical protein